MSIYQKANGIFYYDFRVGGHRYHGSTHETQKGRALQYESLTRTDALEKRLPPAMRKVPKLSDYVKTFREDVDAQHTAGHLAKKTKDFYHYGCDLLKGTAVWKLKLDQIDGAQVEKLAFKSSATGNTALRTLRHILHVAEDAGLIYRAPKFKLFEDKERTAIIEPWLEELMLAEAKEPLRTVMIIMLDSFMRPAEVVSMKWEDVKWEQNQIWIPLSKTKKGKRFVGMTSRMRSSLQSRKLTKNSSIWVFPARSRGKVSKQLPKHMLASSLDKVFRQMKASLLASIRKNDPDWQWSADLVLYSCRHTGATAYSGAVGKNQIEVARALGHADLRTTRRYVHGAGDQAAAMEKVVEMKRRA